MVNSKEEKFQEAYHKLLLFSLRIFKYYPTITPNTAYASQRPDDET